VPMPTRSAPIAFAACFTFSAVRIVIASFW
jgi:hypothetical protein